MNWDEPTLSEFAHQMDFILACLLWKFRSLKRRGGLTSAFSISLGLFSTHGLQTFAPHDSWSGRGSPKLTNSKLSEDPAPLHHKHNSSSQMCNTDAPSVSAMITKTSRPPKSSVIHDSRVRPFSSCQLSALSCQYDTHATWLCIVDPAQASKIGET
jgi:hypothetical protein